VVVGEGMARLQGEDERQIGILREGKIVTNAGGRTFVCGIVSVSRGASSDSIKMTNCKNSETFLPSCLRAYTSVEVLPFPVSRSIGPSSFCCKSHREGGLTFGYSLPSFVTVDRKAGSSARRQPLL